MQAKEIFLQAIEVADAAEREAFVNATCGEDAGLKRKVLALLAANEDPDSFLDQPAARFDVTATAFAKNNTQGLSDSSQHGRFLPGTKLADRYRIVSMLGRGGMGEVYRADDLRLGQTVALKFLPRELAKDAKRLEYFHQEVKLARQISHPNICRVYDIGEVNGQQFLSMEYIDGEDLKTLLHRIGRLPKDKGIQIARQLCSGLAAAHAKGVLHRDLKPANIMIDGQGQVRITDFGLATVSADGENVIGMSGTPAYMAPEQLLRGQTSPRTDIYSLGLILFEVFTGKAAHDASSLPELQRLHEDSSHARSPSDIVDDIDPAVERAITRCLSSDPSMRPRTASELAASLPGGDPLAAALAAGETPHPEIVAMSGDSNPLPLKQAILLLVAIAGCLLGAIFLREKAQWISRVHPMLSPDVLTYRSQQILRHLGIEDVSVQGDYAIGYDDYLTQLDNHEVCKKSGYENWPKLSFWYRQTPGLFKADSVGHADGRTGPAQVDLWYPAWSLPKMGGVRLDCAGKLRWFQATPANNASANKEAPSERTELSPWHSWFPEEFTGFNLTALQPEESTVIAPVVFDQIQGWTGTWPGTDAPLHVVAAAFRGQPVYFEILDDSGQRLTEPIFFDHIHANIMLYVVTHWTFLLVAYGLVIRNIYLRRWDRRGTWRLIAVSFILAMIALLIGAHHSSAVWEFEVIYLCMAIAIDKSLYLATNYVALEPIVRRYWPNLLVSWSRLFSGRITDPKIGRDILVGTLVGTLISACFSLYPIIEPSYQDLENPRRLLGQWETFGDLIGRGLQATSLSLYATFLIVIMQRILRNRLVAVGLVVAFFGTNHSLSDSLPLHLWPLHFLICATQALLLVRFGLLALIISGSVHWTLLTALTFDPSRFYFANGMISIGFIMCLVLFGFVSAIGGWHQIFRSQRVSLTNI
jgi:predicted Ser/Thr protein kinase